MLFCTSPFLIYFLVVLLVYWCLPWREGRVWFLLGASFYFYVRWNAWLAVLIGFTSFVDYIVARGMEQTSVPWRRRFLLLASLVMNLGVLVYFKYANFFIQSFVEAGQAFGLPVSVRSLQVILPVGISFYTFEAINYTVDVYRKRIQAEHNLAHFLLFILFFPHLVAGPIVRARDFLHQIKRRKRWSSPRLLLGVGLFLLGLVKKVVVADRMALVADPVFAQPESYSTAATWLATLAYALQIYGDFSGYSDMALGCAHMLGYKLAINFNMPYVAVNIAEFWHRWHISLSTWLRDYLFIPLGGSRGTWLQTARNLLITMALGGLWHGANWAFVLWGVVHGLLLIGHRAFRAVVKRRPTLDGALQTRAGTAVRMATTFLCVMLCWVLFRAMSLPAAGTIFHRLFVPHSGLMPLVPAHVVLVTFAGLALGHYLGATGLWRLLVQKMPAPVLGVLQAAAFNLVLVLSADQGKTFIYFQF
jgi:alginate O-acetyltransferase complex protein AlgI